MIRLEEPPHERIPTIGDAMQKQATPKLGKLCIALISTTLFVAPLFFLSPFVLPSFLFFPFGPQPLGSFSILIALVANVVHLFCSLRCIGVTGVGFLFIPQSNYRLRVPFFIA
jgi:hypothetical protein